MTRSFAPPEDGAKLLQQRVVLAKRRNHWGLIVEQLAATPLEDRIGDLLAAEQRLDEVCRQMTGLDRVLGLNFGWSEASGQRRCEMKSQIVKRSIVIGGRKTSISLEDAFWQSFRQIADQRQLALSELAGEIQASNEGGNLSSAIRLFVLDYHRDQYAKGKAALALAARRA
jgi:predicted DNA-binding ribbon-helix-helix protein